MKKKIATIILSFLLIVPTPSRADLFGGDVVVLTKILIQTIQQLVQLKKLVQGARDEINLIKNINRGINDSLHLLKTIHPDVDPGLFREWQNVSGALRNIERIYGSIDNVKDGRLYKLNDQSAAEAVVFNNNIFKNAKKIDDIGERIKSFSHQVSPGGAQKLTAESLGVLLHVQNHNLRAMGKSLKLQAQSLARENKKDKENAQQITETVNDITKAMNEQKSQDKFKIPRF